MLVAALLMPPGKQIVCLRLSLQRFILFTTLCEGSISMLVVPLTTIAQQFKVECDRLGISALLGTEVNLTADF